MAELDELRQRILELENLAAQRRRAEDALRESEAVYRGLLDSVSEAIYILDQDGRFLDVNDGAVQMYRYPREQLAGKTPADVSAPGRNDIAAVMGHIERAFGGEPQQFEFWGMRSDGGVFLKDVRLCRGVYFGRDVVVAVARDITDRKRAEEALREGEASYRGLFNSVSEAIGIVDTEGRFLDVNEGAASMYGYAREALVGRTAEFLAAPGRNDLADLAARGRKAFDGEPQQMEFWGRRSSGEFFLKDLRLYRGTYFGQLVVIAVAQDITERKRVDEALRASEAQLSNALKIAHLGPWSYDVARDLFIFNDHFYAMLRTTAADAGGYTMSSSAYTQRFVHPDDAAVVSEEIRKARVTDDPHYSHEVEHRVVYGDGDTGYAVVRIYAVKDAEGRTVRTYGVNQDISERRRAEENLRESEEIYRLLTDTLPNSVTAVDASGRIQMANRRALALFRHPDLSDVLGKPISDWLPDDEQERAWGMFERILAGEILSDVELRLRARDGTTFWGLAGACLVRNRDGQPRFVIVVITDITERKKHEAELLRTQKLESIGVLAGGIAHDFNNLLQGVFGYISLAKMSLPSTAEGFAMLEQAEKALNLSINLTTQLLTFSRGGKPARKRMSLRPVIENAARFALSGSPSHYRSDIDADLWQVEADEGQVAQVIQNIVLNASEAMPAGGAVRIAARNVVMPPATRPTALRGGRFVRITVEDSGVGIPEQYLSSVFDPYFTTKQRGSGLGLATSYSIVKNHDGLIEVSSDPGRGSTFSIYLPAAEVEMEVEAPPAAVVTGGGSRVLVMDDEEIVRTVAMKMVDALGHEAVGAEHGEEAIRKVKDAVQAGTPFDVVILDLTIKGGMGGAEAVKVIREIDPSVKAVVSSGYADTPVLSQYAAYGFSAFLNKPYRLDALRNALNALRT